MSHDPTPGDEIPVLDFPDGIVGYGGPRRFSLVQWGGDDSPFSLLRCVEEPDLAFVVVPPMLFFADYDIELDESTAGRLGLTGDDDALVLVIVTVPDRVQDATANLLGPIVVNTATRVGVQAVLDPDRWSVRRPLSSATSSAA